MINHYSYQLIPIELMNYYTVLVELYLNFEQINFLIRKLFAK